MKNFRGYEIFAKRNAGLPVHKTFELLACGKRLENAETAGSKRAARGGPPQAFGKETVFRKGNGKAGKKSIAGAKSIDRIDWESRLVKRVCVTAEGNCAFFAERNDHRVRATIENASGKGRQHIMIDTL